MSAVRENLSGPPRKEAQARIGTSIDGLLPTQTCTELAPSHASAERYNRIVEENLSGVWRVAGRCGVHASSLDDVIQEVSLVVARKLKQVETGAEREFVVAVTVRVAANWKRTQRRRREDPVSWLEEMSGFEASGYGCWAR